MKTLSPTMQDATLARPYILDRKPAEAHHAGDIILAYTGRTNYEPWVTWWEDSAGNRYTGHYFVHRSGADWDFEHRVF